MDLRNQGNKTNYQCDNIQTFSVARKLDDKEVNGSEYPFVRVNHIFSLICRSQIEVTRVSTSSLGSSNRDGKLNSL